MSVLEKLLMRVFCMSFADGETEEVIIIISLSLYFFLSLDTESIKFRSSSQVWWVAKF